MTDTQPCIRPRASVIRVHDGDTYLMMLDILGCGLAQNGCETAWVRLRDYSARELTDTAPADPKGYGRVDGPTARDIAQTLLNAAGEITVELLGPTATGTYTVQTFGRFAGAVFVDGQELGELLVAQHAVVSGKFEGGKQ